LTGHSGSDEATARLERLARYTPAAVVLYCAVGLAVRLLLSSNLELDESSFVGLLDWSWGYPHSHPPLYHWLVIVFVGAFNYWPAIAILKYLLLAAIGLLIYDTTRRASGSRASGAIAALSLAFVFQIIWQSQATLAHSVLATAAAAGTLHALVMVRQNGRLIDFVWLGVAAAAGLLAKYNFAILVVSLAIAAASMVEWRRALWRPQLALSGVIVIAPFLPHAMWALDHREVTTARLRRLDEEGRFGGSGAWFRGLDGLLSLTWAALSAMLPMVLVRALAQRRDRVQSSPADPVQTLCFRTVVIVLIGSAFAVVAAGVHSVPERYLTVLLVPFPVWLALKYRLETTPPAALLYARVAFAVALACAVALPMPTLFGRTQYSFPYAAVAREIMEIAQPPFAIFSERSEQRANLAIRIPGATIFESGQQPERILAIWNAAETERSAYIERKLARTYAPESEARLIEHPYAYFSGEQLRIYAQVWRRKPSGES
jgi:4-amino-4-deoxy-L-arabinose transferase-like glycosyltransferase